MKGILMEFVIVDKQTWQLRECPSWAVLEWRSSPTGGCEGKTSTPTLLVVCFAAVLNGSQGHCYSFSVLKCKSVLSTSKHACYSLATQRNSSSCLLGPREEQNIARSNLSRTHVLGTSCSKSDYCELYFQREAETVLELGRATMTTTKN